jgi:hypothetical protein
VRWLKENVGWLTFALTLVTGFLGMYVKSAMADTDKRLSLVEMRAETEKQTRRLILQKLDALCRATPQANCPLGTE